MKQFFVMLLILCMFTPSVSFGSDLQTRKSSLYPYQSSLVLQDDFISGGTGGGNVGALGFNLSGGTTTVLASEANRPGLIRRDTSAVINTFTSISISSTSSAFDPAVVNSLTWITRLNTNDANTSVKIGSQGSAFTIAPAAGEYFEKLAADTNWFCVTRQGGVETRTDSGVAVNTSFNTFKYTNNISSVEFRINGSVVCTHTTNLPTSFINPTVAIQNTAAAAKTIDIDYFEFSITSLSR